VATKNFGAVSSIDELAAFAARLLQGDGSIGFDIETGYDGPPKEKHSLHPETAIVVGISFTNSTDWARYVPLRHDIGENLDNYQAARILWPVLASGRGVAHNCFSGETEFITRTGLRRLDECVDQPVEVWTAAGWASAAVRSFGRAQVRRVVFAPYNRSRTSVRYTYRATDNHRWAVQRQHWTRLDGCARKIWYDVPGYVTTVELRPGDRVRALAPELKPDEYSDAFRHGLIYADGSLTSGRRLRDGTWVHQMRLCGWKAKYADRFERVTYPPSAEGDPVVNSHHATYNLKELPSANATPEYLNSFIAAWAALDGTEVSSTPKDTRLISTTRYVDVEWLQRHAPTAGWWITGVAVQRCRSSYSRAFVSYNVTISRHPDMAWTVKEVGDPELEREVFCAVVPGAERFTLGCGAETANSSFEMRHLSRWFRGLLSDDPEHGEVVRASNGYFPVRSDTQVEAYLAAEHQRFGLKYLTKAVFGHEMTELHELFPGLAMNKRKYLRFNILDPADPKVIEYACEDALWCLALHRKYHPKVADTLLYRAEMGVLECICEMEDFGVRYDWAAMRQAADELRAFRDRFNAEIMTELSEMTGATTAVNLASPAQVAEMLFTKLGMRTTIYTATTRELPPDQRKMSTGKIALEGLAKKHPVVQKIREWKEMTRLLGTYLDKYEGLYGYAADGMTHPNHLSAVVVTGRFAVADPPYQQCGFGRYQALTPSGWQRLDQLSDGVPVAQYHDDGTLTFVVPEVVRTPYTGEMIEFASGEGGTWTWTPNHRIVYRQRKPRGDRGLTEIRECSAAEWEARLLALTPGAQGRRLHDRRAPKAGMRRGGEQLVDRESLRLAVACQADGHLRGNRYEIKVYIDRKARALKQMGFDPIQRLCGGRVAHVVTLPASVVDRWLDGTPEKNFRPGAILAMSADNLRYFIEEVMKWDGDATRGCTYGQKTTRRLSVDVVQAAAALCGYATSLYERPEYDAVTVNLWDRTHKEFGWQDVRRVPSDGMVYCVTVPTGMFLCRNDEGKVQVTGNSPKRYHFDLAPAKEVHATHADAHGPKCKCLDYPTPPGTCFTFNFRDCIVAPPDHYIIGFDLSQAELRAIAGEAQEPALLKAFEDGEDVHTKTAALMLGIPIEEVTKDQRDIGKTMNFALGYGMQVKGLADRLGISEHEAQVLFDKYSNALPVLAAWKAKQVQKAKAHGYVTSRFGRRLPIWEYQSDKRWIRDKGDRAAVNYPVQGAATGDFVKIAMVRARQALRAAGLHDRVHLVMNIHDALEFYVHRSVQPIDVIRTLQPAVIFPVEGWPAMKADWHIAKKWGRPVEVEYTSDGRLLVKGEKEFELVPAVEQDEDGEEVIVLPEVDTDALRRAANPDFYEEDQPAGQVRAAFDAGQRHITEHSGGKAVIVELADMPNAEAYQRFLGLLDRQPGPNTLILRTPEGDLPVELTGGTSLTPRDVAAVSLILGPVAITYHAESVDAAELVQGLEL
jgi:DNA polymerase I-like protein with 3'-5' exonuclease and polymerase domains